MTDRSTEDAQGRWRRAPMPDGKYLVAPIDKVNAGFVVTSDESAFFAEQALNALEAELTALRAEKEQAEKKAALASEMAEWLREARKQAGQVAGTFSGDWLSRYDALTQEGQQPKLVCKFYPDTPCPLPNVHCSAPDCMVQEGQQHDG